MFFSFSLLQILERRKLLVYFLVTNVEIGFSFIGSNIIKIPYMK